MKKNYKTIGIVALLVLAGIYLIFSYINGGKQELNKNNEENIFVEEETEKTASANDNNKNEDIVVEIKGEVEKPDIYHLQDGSIIDDLIKMAGGLKSEADITKVNRAQKLRSNECIVIPNINEANNSASVTSVTSNDSNIININTASESELDSLPGVGPATAKAIISYREQNGGFKSIEDIKNVNRIGEKTFEKFKDLITV